MLYSKKEISEVQEILESDKASKLLDSLDNMIGGDLPKVSDMVDDSLNLYNKKSMYISEAVFKKEGSEDEYGFVIEVENEDGDDYTVCSQYKCDEGKVPSSMLMKLIELTSLGYVLKSSERISVIAINLE